MHLRHSAIAYSIPIKHKKEKRERSLSRFHHFRFLSFLLIFKANEKEEFRWSRTTEKHRQGRWPCRDCLNPPPGEKALHLVKRNLLKQHGVLWYSEPVFEFFAWKAGIPWSKCGPYTDFRDKRQFFFLAPSAISFSHGVLRPIS